MREIYINAPINYRIESGYVIHKNPTGNYVITRTIGAITPKAGDYIITYIDKFCCKIETIMQVDVDTNRFGSYLCICKVYTTPTNYDFDNLIKKHSNITPTESVDEMRININHHISKLEKDAAKGYMDALVDIDKCSDTFDFTINNIILTLIISAVLYAIYCVICYVCKSDATLPMNYPSSIMVALYAFITIIRSKTKLFG